MDVSVSSNDLAASDPAHASWSSPVLDDQPVLASTKQSTTDYSETFPFTATTARYIRINDISTHGGSASVSVAEVNFGNSNAVTFSSPTDATASSFNNAGGSPGISSTRDNSGVDATTGAHGTGWNQAWLADDATPWVIYELGAIYDMTDLRFWNGGRIGAYGWGIGQADVWVSNDGTAWTKAIEDHVFNPTNGAHLTGDFSERIPLTGEAGYIKLDDMTAVASNFAIAEFKFVGAFNRDYPTPPDTDAGADRAQMLADTDADVTVLVDGTVDGTATSMLWTDAGATGNVSFDDATAEDTSVTIDAVGTYTLNLAGTNANGTNNDTMTVTIYDADTHTGSSHWDLDGDGDDIGTLNNDGVETGDATYAAGVYGTAMVLDGGDYYTIPNESDYDGLVDTGFTVSAWMKLTGTVPPASTYPTVVSKGISAGGWMMVQQYDSVINDTDNLYFLMMNASANSAPTVYSDDTVDMNDGDWHLFTVTIDRTSGEYKGYTDGTLSTEGNLSSHDYGTNDLAVQIGRLTDRATPPEHDFIGSIDDVRIYDFPLTALQVAELADDGGLAPCLKEIGSALDLADIDNDCDVDLVDFAAMASVWLDCDMFNPADCN